MAQPAGHLPRQHRRPHQAADLLLRRRRLLRRLVYSVDILGGGPAVHYPAGYQEFDGIMVLTRRRVYVRNPDGSPARAPVSIAIDIADVTFS